MTYEFPTSKATFIFRGLTNACPRCGGRHLHKKYFTPKSHCPKCSLKLEKEQGYWTGSLAINMVVTGAVVGICLIVGLITTVPDIPVVPLFLTLLPITIFLPIAFYPLTHTIWMAIDYGFLSQLDD